MKFQWYVIDLEDETVKGTNDIEVLQERIKDSRYILLTAQHGTYFQGSNKPTEVLELSDDVGEDDESDDEDDESDDDIINGLEDIDPSTGAPLNFEQDEVKGRPPEDDSVWPSHL